MIDVSAVVIVIAWSVIGRVKEASVIEVAVLEIEEDSV
tara:strand:- start:16595 stop:16708 length:114 start_codon:yes stop_codon:yes gene_type:complete